jgi:hypothetical protein
VARLYLLDLRELQIPAAAAAVPELVILIQSLTVLAAVLADLLTR